MPFYVRSTYDSVRVDMGVFYSDKFMDDNQFGYNNFPASIEKLFFWS